MEYYSPARLSSPSSPVRVLHLFLPHVRADLGRRGPAAAAPPSLWSPRCHFCARAPFTLSALMCDMKPQLRAFPACDQTTRRGAVLFGGSNAVAWWRNAGKTTHPRVTASYFFPLPFAQCAFIHGRAVVRFALFQPIHYFIEEPFMIYLFEEKSLRFYWGVNTGNTSYCTVHKCSSTLMTGDSVHIKQTEISQVHRCVCVCAQFKHELTLNLLCMTYCRVIL